MTYKVFSKAMKVLIMGTLIVMAFTKGNSMDWLLIGFTAVWIVCMTVYLVHKSGKREFISEDKPEENPEDNVSEEDLLPKETTEDEQDTLPNPSEAETWYRMIGCQTLTDAITDLNTRGTKKLEIKENGDIVVSDKTVDTIVALPEKSLWDTLTKLMCEDGLTAFVGNNTIQISW